MAQLNFYLPDDIEAEVRLRAKAQGVSIFAYLATLVKQELGAHNNWPEGFLKMLLEAGKEIFQISLTTLRRRLIGTRQTQKPHLHPKTLRNRQQHWEVGLRINARTGFEAPITGKKLVYYQL